MFGQRNKSSKQRNANALVKLQMRGVISSVAASSGWQMASAQDALNSVAVKVTAR